MSLLTRVVVLRARLPQVPKLQRGSVLDGGGRLCGTSRGLSVYRQEKRDLTSQAPAGPRKGQAAGRARPPTLPAHTASVLGPPPAVLPGCPAAKPGPEDVSRVDGRPTTEAPVSGEGARVGRVSWRVSGAPAAGPAPAVPCQVQGRLPQPSELPASERCKFGAPLKAPARLSANSGPSRRPVSPTP